jgi:carbon-monoxide dehydrogenase iron sulfur subunit
MNRQFIVCDPNLCVGCQICEWACVVEKEGIDDLTRSRILNVRVEPSLMMSVSCRLCDPPTCVVSCPRDALSQDPEKGTILVDREKCDGCGWCVESCEFGVIIQDRAKTTVDICDLCAERDVPACIECCPKDALSLSTPVLIGQRTRKEVLSELLQEMIEA